MDWIHLAEHKDQWQVLVCLVVYVWVPYRAGNLSWLFKKECVPWN